jgi:uncharacterized protein
MGIAIFFAVLAAVDIACAWYSRLFADITGLKLPSIAIHIYIGLSAIVFATWAVLFLGMKHGDESPGSFNFFFFATSILLLAYIPKLNFALFGAMHHLVSIFSAKAAVIVFKAGLVLAISSFALGIYGIFIGRFSFQLTRTEIKSAKLPKELDGFRIVHISDIHLGSLGSSKKRIHKAIEMINNENPHLVAFTGDLVINFATEAEGWAGVFSGIKSTYGTFSVLGNHDYGKYHNWASQSAKAENQKGIEQAHADFGFQLLKNGHTVINHNGAQLLLAGVENWGKPPFPQFGDLSMAYSGADTSLYSVLLSHDPTHWDMEILQSGLAELTLSGHTHGFQYGINAFGLKWSPVQYIYPKWSGLYHENGKNLYVNIGFGTVGFPGRVGMKPEITLITLRAEH